MGEMHRQNSSKAAGPQTGGCSGIAYRQFRATFFLTPSHVLGCSDPPVCGPAAFGRIIIAARMIVLMKIQEIMMDQSAIVLDVIRARRTSKPALLKADPVPREMIEMVLDAAHWAPSHGITEPWHFTVFTGEGRGALGAAFAAAYEKDATAKGNFDPKAHAGARDRVWPVPVWIMLTMTPATKPDGSPLRPEWEEIAAFGGAVQNLHLQATTLGLSGMWTTGGQVLHPLVGEMLKLPAGRPMGAFILGYPNVAPNPTPRKPLPEKVTWIE
jgi:nitroreductase